MLILGSGAAVVRAVDRATQSNIEISGVCWSGPPAKLRQRSGMSVAEWDVRRDSALLSAVLEKENPEVVLSLNNPMILNDHILNQGARFFNIHNGLVQSYRGISEICVLAALEREEYVYGATLHELIPGQRVDCGPVVAQLSFTVPHGESFRSLMSKSQEICFELLDGQLKFLSRMQVATQAIKPASKAYSYADLGLLLRHLLSKPNASQVLEMGAYRRHFPRIADEIDNLLLAETRDTSKINLTASP